VPFELSYFRIELSLPETAHRPPFFHRALSSNRPAYARSFPFSPQVPWRGKVS